VDKLPLINHVYSNGLLVDFLNQKQELSSFHNGSNLNELNQDFLEKKDLSPSKRKLLVDTITNQYQNTGLTVPDNVTQLLNHSTFTITTGHQLCLFTGPQYFIHKIITIIKSSIDLNKKYPNSHFVPLFWMASEDHDFKEISNVKVFGKEINVDKSFNKAVGELDSSVFQTALAELKELLKNDDKANDLVQLFTDSFSQGNWSDVTRYYLHRLFQNYGLVILDANDKALKASFKSCFSKEIKEKFIFKTVTETNSSLKQLGYKTAINPRELNLFYLDKNSRDRIIFSEESFKIGENKFSLETLDNLIEQQTELFSPNVLMRPIYQEFILPNIAYVGGPSEIIYWLQLKKSFDSSGLEFPLLILRDHFSWIDSKSFDWWKSKGFDLSDFFKSYDTLVRVNAASDNSFDFKNEKEIFNQLAEKITNKSKSIDSSFEQSAMASLKNMEKELNKFETKLIKAFKSKNEQSLAKIKKIQSKVFVEGALIERSENFISPFLNFKGNYFDKLIETSNPFDYSLKLITY
jgi:bacillithiol biosynthesis cysteine-adding enzyme BshC